MRRFYKDSLFWLSFSYSHPLSKIKKNSFFESKNYNDCPNIQSIEKQ